MATSGAMNTSNQYIKYTISVTQNSQNVIANTSNITVSVRFYRTNSGYTTYGTGTVYCKINGSTYSASVTPDQKITSSGIVLFTKTLDVPHNADGTRTVTTSAWISHDVISSNEQSYSQTLTTIPRATTPTVSSSDVNLGSTITISMPRASSSFIHNLSYSFGGTSGMIGIGVGTSINWTIPLSLASQIPNATSGTLIIWCDTYNGTSKIGGKSLSITVRVPSSVVPSISAINVSEAIAGLASQFGVYIQNKSALAVSISAVGSYGSTISSYSSTAFGKTFVGASYTISEVTNAGDVTISVTVKDSRGRTATSSKTVNIASYTPPVINTLTASRCDSDGTLNDEGEYLKIVYAYTASVLNNKNTISAKLTATSASESTTVAETSVSAISSTEIISASPDETYIIELVVSDYFSQNSPSAQRVEAPTAFTLVDYNESGRAVAFGKVSERSSGMEINLDIYDKFDTLISNNLSIYDNGQIDADTTLESLILTELNTPGGGGFYYISTYFYGTKSITSHRTQVAIPYNGFKGIYYRYYFNGSWSSWSSTTIDTGWIDLAISSGWSYLYDSEKPQYRRINNVVYLRGLIDATASAGTTIATLPSGFRPIGYFMRYTCTLNQTDFVNIQINANGVINDYNKGSNTRTFLCLSGISFPVS